MTLVGELSLWVALLIAAWAALVSFAGGATGRAEFIASGERGIHAALALVALASAALWTAILTHDFSLRHVASFTAANLPLPYLIAAFWAGTAGSVLFWALLLAGIATTVVVRHRDRYRALMPYVTGTLALVLVVLLAAATFGANPFARLDWSPLDGSGLRPELQAEGMLLHPPVLYLGYLSSAVPFSFAVGAMLSRGQPASWLPAVRRWSVLTWFLLAAGILLGMWWSCSSSGAPGRWALDPLRSGSLLPWLVLTAYLWSAPLQEKRRLATESAVVAALSTFLLVLLTTVVARGGTISMVHSAAESSVRVWLAGFLVLTIAGGAILLARRRRDLKASAPEAWSGRSEHAPRGRWRYGRYLAGTGGALLLAGFAGIAFRAEHDITLRPGEETALSDPYGRTWLLASEGISRYDALNRQVTAVTLALYRDEGPVRLLTSERRQYIDGRGAPIFEPTTSAAVASSPLQDVRVTLTSVIGEDTAQVRIAFNPLMLWVWLGGSLVALGGAVAFWPPREGRIS